MVRKEAVKGGMKFSSEKKQELKDDEILQQDEGEPEPFDEGIFDDLNAFSDK